MLVFNITPVHALVPLFIIPDEALLYVDIVSNVFVVDHYTKAAIRALHSRVDVAEKELCDEATRPRFLISLLGRL